MDTVKEYRVKVSVRNNLLLKAIEDAGFDSVAGFCRSLGVRQGAVLDIVKFSTSPIDRFGRFTPIAKQIMETLGAAPTDLWTVEQLNLKLLKNNVERDVSQAVLHDLLGVGDSAMLAIENPEDVVAKNQLGDAINEVMETLTPREAKVLSLRFGLDGEDPMTLDEVGEQYGVTPNRILQIEAQALRNLRKPVRANKLKIHLDMETY